MGAGLGTQAGGVGPSVFEEGRGLVGRTPLEEGVVSVWVLGPRGQGCSPSREEASREPGVKEDGERLSLGSPGWGWGLGWTLLGKSEKDQPCSGAEIPLETLVSMEGPGAR